MGQTELNCVLMVNWIVWNRTFWHLNWVLVLYTHKDINNNSNTGNKNRRYERVYFFLPSILDDMRRETQFLKAYANHTKLTHHPRTVHLVVLKISAGRDPKNPTATFNGRLQLSLLKSSKFSGHLFRAWHHPHSQFTQTAVQLHFLSWCLLW